MKKSTFLSILCISIFTCQNDVFAQQKTEAATLFGKGAKIASKDIGFFVAPSIGMTTFDESTAALFNLRSGVQIKDKFALGGYYQVSLNEIIPQSETIPGIYMDYWSAGGFVEYTLLSKKLIHLTLPVYAGYSEVEMDNDFGLARLGEANFLQLEPSLLLEVNLLKNVRFNAGAGYRFVGQMNYRNLDETDMSGLTGHIGLKIGLFR